MDRSSTESDCLTVQSPVARCNRDRLALDEDVPNESFFSVTGCVLKPVVLKSFKLFNESCTASCSSVELLYSNHIRLVEAITRRRSSGDLTFSYSETEGWRSLPLSLISHIDLTLYSWPSSTERFYERTEAFQMMPQSRRTFSYLGREADRIDSCSSTMRKEKEFWWLLPTFQSSSTKTYRGNWKWWRRISSCRSYAQVISCDHVYSRWKGKEKTLGLNQRFFIIRSPLVKYGF